MFPRRYREQSVADALEVCHASLGSGPYLAAVLETLAAADASIVAAHHRGLMEGAAAAVAMEGAAEWCLFACRVVALDASRRVGVRMQCGSTPEVAC
jgi:hypothetical protein